ncbi:MAG: sensor histidine kinase [Woeseiaceae bacterium]
MIFERLTRSLSFRLLAIFLILAGAFIYFATVGIRWVYREDDLRDLISGHLSLHVDYVRQDIGDPPRIDRALEITRKVPVDIRISGNGIEWASDPDFPKVSALEFGASDLFGESPGALLDQIEDVEFAVSAPHTYLKLIQGDFVIVVSTPRISETDEGPDLLPIILAIGLVWLFVAYLCVNWLFRPIRHIRAGAARIGKGDLDHRIERYRNDQLGDLAEDVNKLAGDVRGMLDAKRQLLLGISHELRSPLSRLRLALEFIDEQHKEDLHAEVTEMEQIIATLLEAERLNTRHASLNRTLVNIHELAEQLVETYFSRDKLRIELNVDEQCEANVDDVRLMLLLKNLISNALRYADQNDGKVVVAAEKDRNDLILSVADNGPGFAPHQVSKIGEPFFRGDPSRTRDTGGTGLGIYIARLVAEAHGGSLELDEKYTEGARIVVVLRDDADEVT